MAPISDLRIAVICSSNMNRSMEAHAFLAKKGFLVQSYGTGDKVKIPGSAADKPNIYEFGISYDEIYHDLLNKDKTLYPFLYKKIYVCYLKDVS
jgi:RNA polymerase II subunit A C-terminal domain phosphatase SSU72